MELKLIKGVDGAEEILTRLDPLDFSGLPDSVLAQTRRIFGEGATPPISSTKSLTGHSLGATGVHEAIYCLLMLQNDFIAASANVETLDPAIRPSEIATTRVDEAGLDSVLSNSFGFGGTNASLVFGKV